MAKNLAKSIKNEKGCNVVVCKKCKTICSPMAYYIQGNKILCKCA
jgi:hypothetical protein